MYTQIIHIAVYTFITDHRGCYNLSAVGFTQRWCKKYTSNRGKGNFKEKTIFLIQLMTMWLYFSDRQHSNVLRLCICNEHVHDHNQSCITSQIYCLIERVGSLYNTLCMCDCRYISGHLALLCQQVKKVSSLCQVLQYALLTTTTYQQLIPASPDSTSRSTPQNSSYAANYYLLSKLSHLDLYKQRMI